MLAAAPGAFAQTNTMSTVAGTGQGGFSGEGGPAIEAQINLPTGVAFTAGGGFLISDQSNNKIRRVLPDGTIVTIAGTGAAGFSGDGFKAVDATMNAPNGLSLTADGGTLFSDSNNNRVRLVDTGGVINTVAGDGAAAFGGDNGPANLASIRFPADVAVQSDGGYLVADSDNQRIRRVAPDGTITTVAGNGSTFSSGDNGPATAAGIHTPVSVALTPDGGYVIAERDSSKVRKVAADGTITTIAGTGTAGFSGDGGPGAAAQLNLETGVAAAPDGSVYIADRFNHRVRKVAPDGTITTVVGTGTAGYNGEGAPGPDTQVNQPFDVSVTSEGDVLIVDSANHRIRLLDAGAPPPPPPPVIPQTLTLDPASANRTPGDANVVTASARNNDGSPAAGRTIAFRVDGPNATIGSATTDANGTARISWDGIREGVDTLSAFVDTDGNAAPGNPAPGPGEPTATATVTWTLPPPVQGRVYNLEPVSGIVKIRVVRRGKAAHGAGASAGFAPLTEAQQVPLTTIVDVRKGRVRMTTASSRSTGDVQKGEFYGGIYTTTQPRTGSRPVTELKLTESLICQPNRRGKAGAARARSRRLWGNGKGRFRTRGRHSTATVRGTIWLTKDSCNATTTVVRQGTVVVRDLVKRKNVTVKAGRSYTARARKRR